MFAMNLLCRGPKDWWDFVTYTFSYTKKVVVNWQQLLEMFRVEYVSLVERERPTQEYKSLK